MEGGRGVERKGGREGVEREGIERDGGSRVEMEEGREGGREGGEGVQ